MCKELFKVIKKHVARKRNDEAFIQRKLSFINEFIYPMDELYFVEFNKIFQTGEMLKDVDYGDIKFNKDISSLSDDKWYKLNAKTEQYVTLTNPTSDDIINFMDYLDDIVDE